MVVGTRSFLLRYGLAVAIFALILVIALLLRYFSIQLNLSVVLAVGLVAAAWFGGRGPGIFLLFLILLGAIVIGGVPEGSSAVTVVVGYVSALAVFGLLILLVSGRKSTENRLREQGDLFRITLASIGDAVIATGGDGKITFINSTAERLLGRKSADVCGQYLIDAYKITDEESGKPLDDIFQRIKTDRQVISFSKNILLNRAGLDRLPIIDSGAPIIDSGGKFVGAVIVFQDDSARRRAEQAQIEIEHRLQQSQKLEAIGTLTGGVAHDFNNLLTAILGFTQLAMHTLTPSDEAFDSLVNVEQAGMRAAELTKKLLTFSRQESLDRKVIDLNDSIAAILKLLERVIGEDIKVTFTREKDIRPVNADPSQIEQVIMNLSVNARDAMPSGGQLALETRNIELDEYYCRRYPSCQPGEYVQIMVSDTGSGMDADTLDHIFEPFFTTKDIHKGTGLGLSMVYGIIKQHDGHISVYSEPGQGTTFKLYLPVSGDASHLVQTTGKSPFKGGSETILVAEDEWALRKLSRDVLEAIGYSVISAANGNEAIKIFKERSNEIDLLLLDVIMPSAGGVEVYKEVRGLGHDDVPVIFMTGYSSEVLNHANQSDIDFNVLPVIQKPYTLDGLGRIVREVLDEKRKRT